MFFFFIIFGFYQTKIAIVKFEIAKKRIICFRVIESKTLRTKGVQRDFNIVLNNKKLDIVTFDRYCLQYDTHTHTHGMNVYDKNGVNHIFDGNEKISAARKMCSRGGALTMVARCSREGCRHHFEKLIAIQNRRRTYNVRVRQPK